MGRYVSGDRLCSRGLVEPFGKMLYDGEDPAMMFRLKGFDLCQILFVPHGIESNLASLEDSFI